MHTKITASATDTCNFITVENRQWKWLLSAMPTPENSCQVAQGTAFPCLVSHGITAALWKGLTMCLDLLCQSILRLGNPNCPHHVYHGADIFPVGCTHFLITSYLPICLFATAEHWAHTFRQLCDSGNVFPWVAITNLMFITICANSESQLN